MARLPVPQGDDDVWGVILNDFLSVSHEADGTLKAHAHTAANISDFSTAADARITAQKGVASGLASLDGTTKLPITQIPTGTTSTTVSLGNHSHGTATVATGGTGRTTSTTAYGIIAAGTTATGAHQTIAPGTAGQVLKSNGASALGSFATLTASDVGAATSVHTHMAADMTDFSTAADARILAQKGVANGLATLGADSKIPASQLPAATPSYASRLIGEIVPWPSSTLPSGWLLCNGAAVSRTTYADLFTALGTSYGAGDGTTTFNLPDLRGRSPMGYDAAQTEFDTLGEKGGAKTHTLLTSEMPSHTHPIVRAASGNAQTPVAAYGVSETAGSNRWTLADGTAGLITSATGGGGAHNNLQPYQVTNWIIKALFTGGETSPTSHVHEVSEITDLQTSLNAKADTTALTAGALAVDTTGGNSGNLITDPLFRNATIRTYRTSAATGTQLLEDTNGLTGLNGHNYAQMSFDGSAAANLYLHSHANDLYPIPVMPGQKYRFGTWLKSSSFAATSGFRPTIRIRSEDDTFAYISMGAYFIPSATWTWYEWEWTATSTSVSVAPAFQITGRTAGGIFVTQPLFVPAANSHTHSAGDISSGVLSIDQIPTGSTSTTVSLGNHSHVSATTTTPGFVELATTLEAGTGTDSTRAVTPAGLAAMNSFTDANAITTTGRYIGSGATILSNKPTGASDVGVLEVFAFSNFGGTAQCMQRYTDSTNIWERYKVGSTWGAWAPILKRDTVIVERITTDQAISGISYTAISWNSRSESTTMNPSGTPTILTPLRAGLYQITATVVFSNVGNTTDNRAFLFRKTDGVSLAVTDYRGQSAYVGSLLNFVELSGSVTVRLAVNDIIEIMAWSTTAVGIKANQGTRAVMTFLQP